MDASSLSSVGCTVYADGGEADTVMISVDRGGLRCRCRFCCCCCTALTLMEIGDLRGPPPLATRRPTRGAVCSDEDVPTGVLLRGRRPSCTGVLRAAASLPRTGVGPRDAAGVGEAIRVEEWRDGIGVLDRRDLVVAAVTASDSGAR